MPNSHHNCGHLSARIAVSYHDPKSLKPYPGNPRVHSKAKIRKLARNIEAFGFVFPIVIDAEGIVVAGHARLEAALRLELTEVPVVRIHQRTPGSLLHPQREPLERLEELKKAMGSRAFAAQYQQEPVPGDGQIIRTSWFKRYVRPELPEPAHNVLTVISVDTAQKGLLTSDYSVAMVIRYHRKTRLSYIVDIIRGQLDYPDLRRKIFDLHYRHSPHHWLIEDRGSGTSLIQELNRDYIRPIAINPKGDKLSRVQAITPYLERGEVLLPDNARWIDDFLAETAVYPQGRYDDQVDALAQYLNWVEDGTRPKGGILQMTGGIKR